MRRDVISDLRRESFGFGGENILDRIKLFNASEISFFLKLNMRDEA